MKHVNSVPSQILNFLHSFQLAVCTDRSHGNVKSNVANVNGIVNVATLRIVGPENGV